MHFVDLHCHLLPGIDDGSSSIVETVEMLRVAHRRGTRTIVATPHTFQPMFAAFSSMELIGAYSRMKEELNELSRQEQYSFLQEMDVHLGAENFATSEFYEALEKRKVLTLNGSRYLLVEFSSFMPFPLIEAAVDQILEHELTPVLAHVERYEFSYQLPESLDDLKRRGCVIQINAEAFDRRRNSEVMEFALSVAGRGALGVIASDGHDVRGRPPVVQGAFEILRREFPEEAVETWMSANPSRILANQPLESSE
jgi:protein-tyrosine phosphatase